MSSPSALHRSSVNNNEHEQYFSHHDHFSPQLEQEIDRDEKDFERYGGDDPHDPGVHHYSPSTSSTPTHLPKHLKSDSPSVDDNTAVNTTAEGLDFDGADPNKVDWDSPDDPANPQNMSLHRKIALTGLVTLLTINVTFASSAPSTATLAISAQFGVSEEVSLLVTSLFLMGYVFGPILWSGLSEMYGRRPVFIGTILAYTLFILGQSLATNIQTLLITRFFSGLFASAPLTNGGGFIADIWNAVGRGPAVAVFTAAVFIGPIIGPIVGSFVVPSSLGWRWIFWILMIFSGVCWILCVCLLPETFAPVLLQQKAKRLRKLDPVKNANKYADFEKQDWSMLGILSRTIFRPFIMLSKEPILVLVTIYLALVYGLIYALFEVLPIVFVEIRGIESRLSGLMFIGIGIGTTLGAAWSWWSGRGYVELTRKWRGYPPAEERLDGAKWGGPLLVFAIFWLGWSGAYESVPWYVVELSTIPLGTAIALVFISFQSYIVDTYLMYSASALAANSIIRCLAGAAFPLFTTQMFHNLGVQWASTLLGCISLLLAPLPFLFYKYGGEIRGRSKFAPCIDLKIKAEIEQEEKEAQNKENMA